MINDLRNRRVGLIGADAFIGSSILQALFRPGVTPVGLCGPSAEPHPVPDGINSHTCDLTDAEGLKSWLSGLDVVVHAVLGWRPETHLEEGLRHALALHPGMA